MISQLPTRLPVTREQVQAAIRSETLDVLRDNWRAGLINDADVASYVRVIDEDNFPTAQPLIVDPVRQAITDFQAWAPANLGPSTKPIGSMSGLEGLDGFLKSIWSGVKKVVGGVVKTGLRVIGAGAPQQIVVQPTVQVPPGGAVRLPPGLVQAQVTPGTITEILKSPIVLVGLGLVGFMVMQSMMRPRRYNGVR